MADLKRNGWKREQADSLIKGNGSISKFPEISVSAFFFFFGIFLTKFKGTKFFPEYKVSGW